VTSPLGAEYTYSIDGTTFQSEPLFADLTPGSYTITVKNTDGCTSAETIVINAVPDDMPVAVTITADRTEICDGQSVTFTATPVNGGDNPVYAWYVNGTLVPDETSVTYTYEPADGDVVYATLTSDLDCATDNPATSNEITIKTDLLPVVVTITADQTEICEGQEVTFTAIPENDGDNPVYAWYVNGNLIPGETLVTFTYEPADGDVVHAILTSDLECATDNPATSNEITITYLDELTVSVTIAKDKDEILEGDLVTFTATPVNGGDNPVYTWYVNTVVQAGQTTSTFSYVPQNGDVIYASLVSDLLCADRTPVQSNRIPITVGEPGLTCPPTILLECNVGAIPAAFTTFQEFMNGGGQVEGYDRINPTTFAYTESERTGACPDTIIRTYSVRDNNGKLLPCIQLIIISDTQDPWMDIEPKQVVCETDVPPIYTTLEEFILNGGTADDLCLLDPDSFSFVDEASDGNSCPETITRIYEVYDMCGNRAEAKEIIRVNDDIAPVILACPSDVKNQGGTLADLTGLPFSATETAISLADTTALGISAYDNCGIREITYRDEQLGACNPIITRTFTVYDACGNKVECKQNITLANVVEPVFFAIGPVCQFTEIPPLPSVSQNGITGTWNPASVNTSVAGTIILVFTPDDGQCASAIPWRLSYLSRFYLSLMRLARSASLSWRLHCL
jgi:hypothetical protein